ncbi:MAG: ABC transporter ATP-binding protein [bacterium]|nr:ABC transporter ATP-binding protein [bacterium]
MSGVIKVANLYKKYGSVVALQNITLEVKRGEIVGICGPNGSGKSTFLRILSGIVKPTSGYMEVLGGIVGKSTRKNIAYVSENDTFYKWMRIGELLSFLKTFYPDLNVEVAKELLKNENLELNKKVGELSKGNRQRLKVIMAISRSPEIILLDEPFSGIDMLSRDRILDLLKGFLIGGERTALISTHFVEGLEEIFSRVIFFKEGDVVLDENCEKLREKYGKSVKAMYFEVFGGLS